MKVESTLADWWNRYSLLDEVLNALEGKIILIRMTRGSKADEILTLGFYANGHKLQWYVTSLLAMKAVFLYCGGAAIVLRLVQYVLRLYTLIIKAFRGTQRL